MKNGCLVLLAVFALWCAPAAADDVPISRDQITLSFAPVVKRVVPAVVNIYTRRTEKVDISLSPFMNDPLFREFFGMGYSGSMPRERVVRSLGSGVIVGADGTIVTSYHVVKGSEKITVILSDKRELEGHVEKVDERADIAILKVDTKGERLPVLQLRDSSTLEVGDLVLAVGDPFGVGTTVTSGIISALSRSAAGVSDYQYFIQTDAAINPGNSGGALVDMQGRLIGINDAIYTRSGGTQGIGFAIPADMVHAVLESKANKTGSVIRPWFGVFAQAVTQEIAQAQGLDIARGVLVQQVSPGSPAEKSGIRPGDIILSIGGDEINDAQSLNFKIATTGIGNPVTAAIWRGGVKLALQVTFTMPPAESAERQVLLRGGHPLNGVIVAQLTPDLAEEFHISADEERVVVVRASQNGESNIQMKEGDIIVSVNGKDIHTVSELGKVLQVRLRTFEITVVREGVVLTMSVTK